MFTSAALSQVSNLEVAEDFEENTNEDIEINETDDDEDEYYDDEEEMEPGE